MRPSRKRYGQQHFVHTTNAFGPILGQSIPFLAQVRVHYEGSAWFSGRFVSAADQSSFPYITHSG
jgi:hypothetical protein